MKPTPDQRAEFVATVAFMIVFCGAIIGGAINLLLLIIRLHV